MQIKRLDTKSKQQPRNSVIYCFSQRKYQLTSVDLFCGPLLFIELSNELDQHVRHTHMLLYYIY